MRLRKFWRNASDAERAKLRKIAVAHDRIGNCFVNIVYPLIFGILFAPMAAVMLMQHYNFGTYTETVCNGTQDVYYAWCKMMKPPCGRAHTVTVTGQKVTLNFPSYSRHLEQWRTNDYDRWLKTVRSATFPCFVENSSKSTKGVIYTTLTGLYGWWFMAGLAGLLLGIALCGFVVAGFSWIEFSVRTSRLEPHLAEFVCNLMALNGFQKNEYLNYYELRRTRPAESGNDQPNSASENDRAIELAIQNLAAERAAPRQIELDYWLVNVDLLADNDLANAQPKSRSTTPDFEVEPPPYEDVASTYV